MTQWQVRELGHAVTSTFFDFNAYIIVKKMLLFLGQFGVFVWVCDIALLFRHANCTVDMTARL